MNRREFLATAVGGLLVGSPRPGAAGEELRLWRALWAADWSRSFSLKFVDDDGETRRLDWVRFSPGSWCLGMLTTYELDPDGSWWPAFGPSIYKETDWQDEIGEMWDRYFREWCDPPGAPASLVWGRQ